MNQNQDDLYIFLGKIRALEFKCEVDENPITWQVLQRLAFIGGLNDKNLARKALENELQIDEIFQIDLINHEGCIDIKQEVRVDHADQADAFENDNDGDNDEIDDLETNIDMEYDVRKRPEDEANTSKIFSTEIISRHDQSTHVTHLYHVFMFKFGYNLEELRT